MEIIPALFAEAIEAAEPDKEYIKVDPVTAIVAVYFLSKINAKFRKLTKSLDAFRDEVQKRLKRHSDEIKLLKGDSGE